MNTPPVISPLVPVGGEPLKFEPTFFRAWRGIWLLTWKNQFTWQKLPLQILGFLVLPTLILITTKSPTQWAQRRTIFSNPLVEANHFFTRLDRSGISPTSEQRLRMRQIFVDEFSLSEKQAREADGTSQNQQQQLRMCYDRIQSRAPSVLDAGQLTQLETFVRRNAALVPRSSNPGPVWTRTTAFYRQLIDIYFFIVLPLHCVARCGGLIRDELQSNTLGFLLTRPVGRARLLVLKFLSQAMWLELILLLQTLLIFGAGAFRQIPGLIHLLPLFLFAQILAVLAWSALGIFLGQISKRYVALALVYGVIVELGIGRIPTNINSLSIMRHLKTLLSHNSALQNLYEWTATGLPVSIGALVLATILFLGMATLLFTCLEYHHTAEMQK